MGKRLNQKGYLLLESVVSWFILVSCLLVYLPFFTQMWQTIHLERNETEQARIGLEQVQKLKIREPNDAVWTTGGKSYTIVIPTNRKGVRVYDETQDWQVQMQSFNSFAAEP